MTIYILLHLFLGQYKYIYIFIFKSLEIQFSMCQFPKSAAVIFFLSTHIMWEFTRYGLQEKTERLILSFDLMLIGNGKVLRLYSDTHAALPPLSSAVNWIFQFSSAPRGGNLAIAALPPLPSAVKSIFQFSSAPRGGKLEIAFMLRAHVAEIFQSGFLSFFPFFCLLVGLGSGLSSTKRTMDACE